MTVQILVGDVLAKLAELPDESVHIVICSPPYWGLRDYGVEGQIGLEPTLGEHLEVMVKVFAEIWRVLRKDGTCWINYGDCYATTPSGKSAAAYNAEESDDRTFRDKPFSTVGPIYDANSGGGFRGCQKRGENNAEPKGRIVASGTLKPKDLCMIPNRLAIALQDWGWWVRSEVIWHKLNPMPESITDRPATSHEKMWLLSKSSKYFYDADAVRVASDWNPDKTKAPDGWDTGPGAHGTIHRKGREKGAKVDRQREVTPRHKGQINHTKLNQTPTGEGRNLRNVWSISIAGFDGEYCCACSTYFSGPEKKQIKVEKIRNDEGEVKKIIRHCPCGETDEWISHFATFPPALIEPCIKAGTSEYGVCPDCGAPWRRETEKNIVPTTKAAKTFIVDGRDDAADKGDQGSNRQKDGHKPGHITKVKTLGWKQQCKCDPKEPIPATVLDPFGGAGTTALVADRLGRDCILIELNPEYVEISKKRLQGDSPLFAQINNEPIKHAEET